MEYLTLWRKEFDRGVEFHDTEARKRIKFYEKLGVGLHDNQRTESFTCVGQIIRFNYMLDKLASLVIKRGKLEMASKKKTVSEFQWNMVNIELTAKEKEAFKTWYSINVATIEENIAEALHEGYKMSVSYSTKNERYYATITQTDDNAEDAKTSQMSHSGNLLVAMGLAYWKWAILGEGCLVERKGDNDDFA